MNVCLGIPGYRIFRILLDSGCSSVVVNGQMTQTLRNKYTPATSTEWSTQGGNFTAILMANIEFSLPDLSATKIMTW